MTIKATILIPDTSLAMCGWCASTARCNCEQERAEFFEAGLRVAESTLNELADEFGLKHGDYAGIVRAAKARDGAHMRHMAAQKKLVDIATIISRKDPT